MTDDEDPIVGADGAAKPEERNEGDGEDGARPRRNGEPSQSTVGKHRRSDDE